MIKKNVFYDILRKFFSSLIQKYVYTCIQKKFFLNYNFFNAKIIIIIFYKSMCMWIIYQLKIKIYQIKIKIYQFTNCQ